METKANIRKILRSIRMELAIEEVCDHSRKICEKLMNDRRICQNDYIFVYSATQNEVDLTEFIRYALGNAMKVAFPRVDGADMDFYEIQSWEDLFPGYQGILEPQTIGKEPVLPVDSDVMLFPGVVFDRKGGRIGYGGGYYDRYLAGFRGTKLGLVYRDFIVNSVPHGRFDLTVDVMITERGLYAKS